MRNPEATMATKDDFRFLELIDTAGDAVTDTEPRPQETVEPGKGKRVTLVLRGELFNSGPAAFENVARQIEAATRQTALQVIVVLGGGNHSPRSKPIAQGGIDEVTLDEEATLASAMNGVRLRRLLINLGLDARMLTADGMTRYGEAYVRDRADRLLNQGCVVILAGAGLSPYSSTAFVAVTRSLELNSAYMLVGQDGHRGEGSIGYWQAMSEATPPLDLEALALMKRRGLDAFVFDPESCSIEDALRGKGTVGTMIGPDLPEHFDISDLKESI
jgi:uridylate kinase